MDMYILGRNEFENPEIKNNLIKHGKEAWIFFGIDEVFGENAKVEKAHTENAQIEKSQIKNARIRNEQIRNTRIENAQIEKKLNKYADGDRADVYVFMNEKDIEDDGLHDEIITSGIQMLDHFDKTIEGLLIKRSTFINTGCFHEMLTCGGNLEFCCRAADAGTILVIPSGHLYLIPSEQSLVIPDERSSVIRNEQLPVIPNPCEGSLSSVNHTTEGDDHSDGKPDEIDVFDKADEMIDFLLDNAYIRALAYICCRYQIIDPAPDGYEQALNRVLQKLISCGVINRFAEMLSEFVSDTDLFDKWVRNTAPVYIITGDDTAYGVLKDFALKLAEAFGAMGQAVITKDGSYQPYSGIQDIEGRPLKALIGFQAPILFDDFFKSYAAPKLQFWFDDPVFFDDIFQQIEKDDSYYILCQDGYHAEHLKEHYHIRNAIHFPPGGIKTDKPSFDDRQLDVVFIGTYTDPDEICPSYYMKRSKGAESDPEDFRIEYIDHMITHPGLTYEQGVRALLHEKNIELPEEKYMQLLWSLADAFRYVRACFRSAVIETVLAEGIKLHVYSDSWKKYDKKGKENLILHPSVNPEESLDILSRAKVSLNIMSWHKDGMTERITNTMLRGAVCVSDETKYLKEHFDNNSIMLYSLSSLDRLPGMIKNLLSDETLSRRITENAWQKATESDTWEKKAEKILTRLLK